MLMGCSALGTLCVMDREPRHFSAEQFVGCVITEPVVPPMIAAARGIGCRTLTGEDMFAKVRDLLLQFLLEAP